MTVNPAQGAKFVEINPYDGNLYATAQTPVLVGNVGAAILATDVYMTTSGLPVGTVAWQGLGFTSALHAPRGLTFVNANTMFVCDNGYGLRRLLFNGNSWTIDPVTYIAQPADANITQAALHADGFTLFAVTPNTLYAFDTATLTWVNGGSPLAYAGPNQVRLLLQCNLTATSTWVNVTGGS